jgi:DNA polymerase-1
MAKLTLLLDGDVFAYKAASSSECAIQWDENTYTLDANLDEAKDHVDSHIAAVKKELKATTVIIALSDIGSGYWRRRVLPSYKMNRKATRKPLVLQPLRQYLIDKYKAKLKPLLEGDDVLGILATHPTLIPGEKIIVSVDKDMKTIPGRFYRNLEGKEEMFVITRSEADYNHMLQTLTGDTTDGYKGCPGVGPVAAAKILNAATERSLESTRSTTDLSEYAHQQMWESVVTTFVKKGLNEEAALVQARVARILRYTDYDFTNKLPILWTPPEIPKGTNDGTTGSTTTTAVA